MIQINFKDSNGIPCELGDVLVCHFPNELIKYFGCLIYQPDECRFLLSDMYEGWQPINLKSDWQTYERLCSIDDAPAIKKELGKVEVQDVKEFDKIFNLTSIKM